MFQLLDLGVSSLQTLDEDSLYFSAQNVLAYLDRNIIDTLHENTFSGFPPSLLDVSNNNLNTLDQRVFQVRSKVVYDSTMLEGEMFCAALISNLVPFNRSW